MDAVEFASARSADRTIGLAGHAIAALADTLAKPAVRATFDAVVAAIAGTRGRVIVTGMGKSGLIGRKIAATMTSTGTPSVYVHPGEASHGDLGMVSREDIVLALTWSGETAELSDIISYCRRFGVRLVVVTAKCDSTAGRAADICLTLPYVTEACPHQLAPTSSTTMQLVLGDALAVALIEARGFSAQDFSTFHPRGTLGAQLTTVAELMGRGDQVPMIGPHATLIDATIEMSRKRYGSTAVVDDQGNLIGVFTDGDLRRSFATRHLGDDISAHMTLRPLSVAPTMLTSEALRIMNENAVTMLFVCEDARLVGALHLHDVLRAGTR